jgi:NTP pyrophosphatase (non-canonical NTP hydrolase)
MGNETQESVHRWIEDTFPGVDPESPRKSLRALEEMVELCLASGATTREVWRAVATELEKAGAVMSLLGGLTDVDAHPRPDKIASEAADVLIVLYGLAGMRGFDLHAEVDRKMEVNRGRRWEAMGDGTGYHIKTEATP